MSKSKAMTKSELIRRILSNHQNLFLKDATRLVDTILDEISGALERGDRVELRGFGSFSVRHRKPRMARNPKTNEVVPLGERSAPYFRAGKELRERINKAHRAAAAAGILQA